MDLQRVYSSEVLNRFNMYSSIAVNGTAADGYSSGDAIRAIQEVAAQVLPKGYGYDFDGITREEAQTGSNTTIIFGICILLIYLILSGRRQRNHIEYSAKRYTELKCRQRQKEPAARART